MTGIVAATADEEVEAMIEPGGEVGDAEVCELGRGQLDREREAVQSAAHLVRDRSVFVVEREPVVESLCAVHEQFRGVVVRPTPAEPGHAEDPFVVDLQRSA